MLCVNSLGGSFRFGRPLNFTEPSRFILTVLWVQEDRIFLGAVGQRDFSDVPPLCKMKLIKQNESQHFILMGDFNVHLDISPDQCPEGHISMLPVILSWARQV